MKLTSIPRKVWKITKDFSRFCKYYWNKVVRRISIDSQPVFIVGCGHSGTSLLLAILGTHSRIFAIPYESEIAFTDDQKIFQKELEKFDKMTILAGKNRWVEKTPRHIRYIGKILNWRPDARILIIVRDGRDVACSIRERLGSLEDGIKRWVSDNLLGKEYWSNPNVNVVKYEDLVSDFEHTIRGILKFLDEDYEDGMKEYYKIPRKWYSDKITKPPTPSGKDHAQYRNWQINQPLFDGRGQWKELSEKELSLINDVAGKMLAELGYVDNDNLVTE
jgi:hypothetical protein